MLFLIIIIIDKARNQENKYFTDKAINRESIQRNILILTPDISSGSL